MWGVWTADQGYFVVLHAGSIKAAIDAGRTAWQEWRGYHIGSGIYLDKSKQYSPIATVCLEMPQLALVNTHGPFYKE
jgi:hypothetical protein